jgi:hypothetical protein
MSHYFSLKPVSMACAVLVSALTLAACGSGGGNSSNASSTVEGYWSGTQVSGGTSVAMFGVVLEDGTLWMTYSIGQEVIGIFKGAGTSSNGLFSAPNSLEFPISGTPIAANLSGPYVSKTSFTLNGIEPSRPTPNTFTFPLAYDATYDLSFSSSQMFASIAGNWTAPFVESDPQMVLVVGADGRFTAKGNGAGCEFSGRLSPRSSGRNVYDFSGTFGSSPCPATAVGRVFNGVAQPIRNGAGTAVRLLVQSVDTTNTLPLALTVSR